MRRIAVLTSLLLSFAVWPATGNAQAEIGETPAVTINYTEDHILPKNTVKRLVQQVNDINPEAFYDIVGYETTPKNEKKPVSKRVRQIEELLLSNGVAKDKIYLLIRPSDLPYQKVNVFVRN